jgi:hypothetical protein
VAHSITFVAFSNNIWTSDVSGSSGRSGADLVDLNEKKPLPSWANAFAECELDNHDRVLG